MGSTLDLARASESVSKAVADGPVGQVLAGPISLDKKLFACMLAPAVSVAATINYHN